MIGLTKIRVRTNGGARLDQVRRDGAKGAKDGGEDQYLRGQDESLSFGGPGGGGRGDRHREERTADRSALPSGLLLDTHVFLWALTDDSRLNQAARREMLAAEAVYISAAS